MKYIMVKEFLRFLEHSIDPTIDVNKCYIVIEKYYREVI